MFLNTLIDEIVIYPPSSAKELKVAIFIRSRHEANARFFRPFIHCTCDYFKFLWAVFCKRRIPGFSKLHHFACVATILKYLTIPYISEDNILPNLPSGEFINCTF